MALITMHHFVPIERQILEAQRELMGDEYSVIDSIDMEIASSKAMVHEHIRTFVATRNMTDLLKKYFEENFRQELTHMPVVTFP